MNGRKGQSPPGLRSGPPPETSNRHGLVQSLLNLLLVLTLAAVSLRVAPVAALTLPWQQHTLLGQPAATSNRMGPLQEVSPPEAVLQLQSALGGRQPVVEILSPEDDSVLPAGPWSLKLRVHDWPLVDGGTLGVGPHLAVQLDQEPPRIWTRSEGMMPELSPGSHRLTVYAALPWGEARKNPGAVQQIRLHRTAPNPLSLPEVGSPQLLAVSPAGPAGTEPLLLDWLLLDAPLQDVGGSGTQWRLRVTINGEDVLLDEQSPLWLRGWQPGLNALRLELLDARGEPLNPPFNSLVQEVDLGTTAGAPRWRGATLSASELGFLLGEAPPAVSSDQAMPAEAALPEGSLSSAAASNRNRDDTATSPAVQAPPPLDAKDTGLTHPQPSEGSLGKEGPVDPSDPTRNPATRQPLDAVPASAPAAPDGAPSPARTRVLGPAALAPISEDSATPPAPAAANPPVANKAAAGVAPAEAPQSSDAEDETRDDEPASAAPTPGEQGGAAGSEPDVPETRAQELSGLPQPAPAAATEAAEVDRPAQEIRAGASDPSHDPPQQTMPPTTATPPQTPSPTPGTPLEDDDRDRVHPTAALTGRARDLVNDDGTLRRPERRGPLAGLRERLQP